MALSKSEAVGSPLTSLRTFLIRAKTKANRTKAPKTIINIVEGFDLEETSSEDSTTTSQSQLDQP